MNPCEVQTTVPLTDVPFLPCEVCRERQAEEEN